MEINKPISPFDERTDFTRGNKDRMPYGKSNGTDQFNLGSEYDLKTVASDPPPLVDPPPPTPAKFTHKLTNGTVLEAASMEELAGLIEKSFSQPPTLTLDFEDKPLYQPIEFKRKDLSLVEQAEILNVWKENPQKALRMLEEAEYGASMESIMQNLSRAEQKELSRRQEEAGAEFVMETDSYNPTRANGQKLTAYLREKGKPITKHNLLVAFNQMVAAGDTALVRKADPDSVVPDPDVIETPPPPTIIPSNQGRPEAPQKPGVDAAAFSRLSLKEQQEYFARLRRSG